MVDKTILFSLLISLSRPAIAQPLPRADTIIHFSSTHTSFPDTGRIYGHSYDSVLYDAANHYQDSSVLVLFPQSMQGSKKLNIVFWFHGWRNNIDTALNYYHLAAQFLAAKRNAILVLAETAKNSPDSYGGKLEQPGIFKALVEDVLARLREEKFVSKACTPGNIVLAGHSGAYRVMAAILQNGGLKIREVQLFDALYGETDKFKEWLRQDNSNRLINWFTNQGGGTDEVSLQMMDELKKEGMPPLFLEEAAVNSPLLQSSRIVFVHSTRAHNDIIFNPDHFRLLLESSVFLR